MNESFSLPILDNAWASESSHGNFPPPQPYERKRRYVAKVKTGCSTCKSRRVKCDETKPLCKKCTSTGRKCEGYAPNPVPIADKGKQASSAKALITLPKQRKDLALPKQFAPNLSPPAGIEWGKAEKDSLHYLSAVAAPGLLYQLECRHLMYETCQAAHIYPAVWYAMIAFGASLKGVVAPLEPAAEITSLKSYNLAIKELSKFDYRRVNPVEKAMILTTAGLLSYTCSVRRHEETALTHLEGCLNLFNQWFTKDNPAKAIAGKRYPVMPEYLAGYYFRLDNDATLLMGKSKLRIARPVFPCAFDEFSSLRDAITELEVLLDSLLQRFHEPGRFMRSPRDVETDTRAIYRKALRSWVKKLDDYTKSGTADDSPRAGMELRYLHTRRLMIQIVLNYDSAEGEMGWDRFHEEFRQLVEIFEEQVQTEVKVRSTESIPSSALNQFLSHNETLSVIACHCRDSVIRRKALDLRSSKMLVRQDGYGYGFADAFVDLEEKQDRESRSACCVEGKICHSHRISHVHFVYGVDSVEFSWRKHEIADKGMEMVMSMSQSTELPRTESWDWMGLTNTWSSST